MTHCQRQLERILDSDRLRQSRSLVQLLEYLGQKSLEGAGAGLKEYTIGVEALGKPDGYDPQVDASVRSQVRRLRAKLAQYYDAEGSSDPIHITLPRGGFELQFEPRAGVAEPPRAEVSTAASSRRTVWLLAIAVCSLAAALLVQTLVLAPDTGRVDTSGMFTAEMEELWRPYLTSSRPSVICLGIPMFLHFARDSAPTVGTIRDSSTNAWSPDNPRIREWSRILDARAVEPWYRYMAVGEAMGAYALGKNLLAGGLDVPIVRSPEMTWDAISSNNVIYLGAPKVNPQLRIESFSRYFRISESTEAIENLEPAPGEPERFPIAGHDGERFAPALIGRYPSTGGGGYTTVIGSSTNLAVWGAVEYLTRPQYAASLVGDLRQRYGQVPEFFEAVVMSRLVDDHPVSVELLAVRRIDDAARATESEP